MTKQQALCTLFQYFRADFLKSFCFGNKTDGDCKKDAWQGSAVEPFGEPRKDKPHWMFQNKTEKAGIYQSEGNEMQDQRKFLEPTVYLSETSSLIQSGHLVFESAC